MVMGKLESYVRMNIASHHHVVYLYVFFLFFLSDRYAILLTGFRFFTGAPLCVE